MGYRMELIFTVKKINFINFVEYKKNIMGGSSWIFPEDRKFLVFLLKVDTR